MMIGRWALSSAAALALSAGAALAQTAPPDPAASDGRGAATPEAAIPEAVKPEPKPPAGTLSDTLAAGHVLLEVRTERSTE